MRSGRPPPYSSAWISTSAAFGGPDRRGRAQECGSASFSWYAERWITNSSDLAEVRVALDVGGQRGAVVGVGDGAQREVHLLGRGALARAAASSSSNARSKASSSAPRNAIRPGSHSQRSSTPGSPP